jgi:transcriptional regulator with XRE-family HTH domain
VRNEIEAIAFGRVLRKGRAEARLSQRKLAKGAGIAQTYASLMERGMRVPTITTIIGLAGVLGQSPGELVSRTSREMLELEQELGAGR